MKKLFILMFILPVTFSLNINSEIISGVDERRHGIFDLEEAQSIQLQHPSSNQFIISGVDEREHKDEHGVVPFWHY